MGAGARGACHGRVRAHLLQVLLRGVALGRRRAGRRELVVPHVREAAAGRAARGQRADAEHGRLLLPLAALARRNIRTENRSRARNTSVGGDRQGRTHGFHKR